MPRQHISHYARALILPLTPLSGLGLRQECFFSDRLTIRTLKPQDVYDTYECGANPDFTAQSHGYMRPFRHLEDAQRQIDNMLSVAASGYCLPYTIMLSKDERYLGFVTLTVEPGWSQRHRMDIEYGIDPRWWGNGFATEAVRAIIAHVFVHYGVIKLEGRCVVENLPSMRVMERAGMKRVAILEQHHAHEGRFDDIALYAILKRDHRPSLPG